MIPVGLGIVSGFVAAGYVLKSDALKLPGLICGIVLIVTLLISCRLQVREKFIVRRRSNSGWNFCAYGAVIIWLAACD